MLCWRGACLGVQAAGSCAPHVIAASAWPGAFRVICVFQREHVERCWCLHCTLCAAGRA